MGITKIGKCKELYLTHSLVQMVGWENQALMVYMMHTHKNFTNFVAQSVQGRKHLKLKFHNK